MHGSHFEGDKKMILIVGEGKVGGEEFPFFCLCHSAERSDPDLFVQVISAGNVCVDARTHLEQAGSQVNSKS